MRFGLIFRGSQLFTMVVVGWMLMSCLLSHRAALAQTAPFYQGKTIRIIVGFTTGGLYDQYARVFARHMPKYIPGNPNIIVQNMPGAGSLTATNYVYGVVKPDGLTLGMVGSGIYLDQLLERKEAQFDMRKLNYIGSVDQRDLVLYMKADAPETRALLSLWNKWQPDLFIDCHVTDGADYRYNITYQYEHHDGVAPGVLAWERKVIDGIVAPATEAAGNVVSWYLEFKDNRDLTKGIQDFNGSDRADNRHQLARASSPFLDWRDKDQD